MRRHAKGTRGEARNVCKGCRLVKDVKMYKERNPGASSMRLGCSGCAIRYSRLLNCLLSS